jgi:hypothetical protein
MTGRWLRLALLTAFAAACGDAAESTGPEASAAAMVAISLAADTVAIGETIDPPIAVRVENPGGVPVEGIPVRFALVSGPGELFPTLAVSNLDGIAEATFRAGSTPGESLVRVDIPSATQVAGLDFVVVTEPAGSVELTVVGGDAQQAEIGSQLPIPFEVRASAPSGVAAGGITLAWSVIGSRGGARLTADTTSTDSDGVSRVLLTLGREAVEHAVTVFAVGGIESDTVRFTAVATETFLGNIALDSVRPSPLLSGAEATLFGAGFAAALEGNEVRIEGEAAEVLEASPTRLRIVVPEFAASCLPERDVGVRVLAGGEPSNGRLERLRPGQEILDLAIGEVRTLRDPVDLACWQLGSAAEPREYRIAVQSTRDATGVSPVVRLATRAETEPMEARLGAARMEASLEPDQARLAQVYASAESRIVTTARRELVSRRAVPVRPAMLDSTRQPSVAATAPAAGDSVRYRFAVGNDLAASCTDTSQVIRGVVREVRANVILVEDVRAPAEGFTAEDWTGLAEDLDRIVFPIDTLHFGAPADIDGNGRVVFLFTPEVNRLSEPGTARPLAGIALPLDLAVSGRGDSRPGPGSEACPASNEAELIYLAVPDPDGEVGEPVQRPRALVESRKAAAHQLQHLINAGRRVSLGGTGFGQLEEAWLDEGLSHLAEEVVGLNAAGLGVGANLTYGQATASREALELFNAYQLDNFYRLGLYMSGPQASSVVVTDDPAGVSGLQMRGFAWYLLRWLVDRESRADPGAFLRPLVAGGRNHLRGLENLESTTGRTWEELSAEFAAMLASDDLGIAELEERYTAGTWDVRDLFANLSQNPLTRDRFVAEFPLSPRPIGFETTAVDFDVRPYTTAYFEIRSSVDTPALALSLVKRGGDLVEESSGPQITIVRTR